MIDHSEIVFGNKQSKKIIKKANKSKQKWVKKFGDDSNIDYKISFEDISSLKDLNVKNIVFSKENSTFPKNSLIVGNIRMGFGHYRISIAMASCAKALGYTPLWLDLASFDCTGSKVIRAQNDLYSMGSRLSQKSFLFNKVWEYINCETFKQLSYNGPDQKNSELLVPIFKNIPKDTPYIATHVWPSQGAIHANLTNVVNAIPDNWPMALHLSEGAIHTVQTPFAYLGYKKLNGFSKKTLKPIPEDQIKLVGHYIDHELVSNIELDNQNRINRIDKKEPYRILLTVGGAGAGQNMFLSMIKHLIPYVERKEVALFINFGDHLKVYNYLCKKIKNFDSKVNKYFNDYDKLLSLINNMDKTHIEGIHVIYNNDIFKAVYSTNLLMRHCELLVTKPSELAYYPIPKLFMKHIGGHEVYGAIYSSEIGDGTWECPTSKSLNEMLDYLINDKSVTKMMCKRIEELKKAKYYDGGYECVKLATNKK